MAQHSTAQHGAAQSRMAAKQETYWVSTAGQGAACYALDPVLA